MPQDIQRKTKQESAGPDQGQMPVRLNRYLAQSGICSRREADRLIAEGKVTVDGRTASIGQKVLPGQDVRAGEKEAVPEKKRVLLAVNKPRGVVCTTDKRWGDRTIGDLVDYPCRVFSMGRLDKDSEGLLLMTNDGMLQERMMRAANYHEKEYLVSVNRRLNAEDLRKMERGVYLRELDTATRPCRVRQTGDTAFSIVLTQGLNRQIRRMCEKFGYRVTTLKRVRIMNIELGDLAPGAYREVSRAETEALFRELAKQK